MIVTCPACRSRYRCADSSLSDATAHCSACDESFPLGAQRQSYRLARSGSSLSATMPMVAVAEAAPGTPLTPEQPPAEESGPGMDPLLEGCPPSVHIDLPSDSGASMPAVHLPIPELHLPEMASSLEELHSGEAAPPEGWLRLPQTVGEMLVPLVPASVGGGLAYYFAGPFGQTPSLWAALGATVGLLFGWACLLWITHED